MSKKYSKKGGGYTFDVSNPLNCGNVTYKAYTDNNAYVASGDLGLIPLVSNVYTKHDLTGGKKMRKNSKKLKTNSRCCKCKCINCICKSNNKVKSLKKKKSNLKDRCCKCKCKTCRCKCKKTSGKYSKIKVGQTVTLSNGACAKRMSNGRFKFIKKSQCKSKTNKSKK